MAQNKQLFRFHSINVLHCARSYYLLFQLNQPHPPTSGSGNVEGLEPTTIPQGNSVTMMGYANKMKSLHSLYDLAIGRIAAISY